MRLSFRSRFSTLVSSNGFFSLISSWLDYYELLLLLLLLILSLSTLSERQTLIGRFGHLLPLIRILSPLPYSELIVFSFRLIFFCSLGVTCSLQQAIWVEGLYQRCSLSAGLVLSMISFLLSILLVIGSLIFLPLVCKS